MTPRKLPEHERHPGGSPQHTACIATKVPHSPCLAIHSHPQPSACFARYQQGHESDGFLTIDSREEVLEHQARQTRPAPHSETSRQRLGHVSLMV